MKKGTKAEFNNELCDLTLSSPRRLRNTQQVKHLPNLAEQPTNNSLVFSQETTVPSTQSTVADSTSNELRHRESLFTTSQHSSICSTLSAKGLSPATVSHTPSCSTFLSNRSDEPHNDKFVPATTTTPQIDDNDGDVPMRGSDENVDPSSSEWGQEANYWRYKPVYDASVGALVNQARNVGTEQDRDQGGYELACDAPMRLQRNSRVERRTFREKDEQVGEPSNINQYGRNNRNKRKRCNT